MRLLGLIFTITMPLIALADPVTSLYQFVKDGSGLFANGQNPNALVRDDAGNLYGSTSWAGVLGDGSTGKGTIFKLNGATGQLSVLHTFSGTSDGSDLYKKLVLDSQGNLYGTAREGGENNSGTLFRVSSNIPLTVLQHFNEETDGSSPFGLVSDSEGNLWGATGSGGSNSNGTIFKFNETDRLTVAYNLSRGDVTPPHSPRQIMLGNDGMFYGVSNGGVNFQGAVFKFDPINNNLTTVYSLEAISSPMAGLLVQDDSGNLYGTIATNQTHSRGAVFKLEKQVDGDNKVTFAYSVLHDFEGAPNDGFLPWGGLVFGNDGHLYGTTQLGGANDLGTVFRLDLATNDLTILHSFSGGDGSSPLVEMHLGGDGNLYGTTNNGGASDGGTIFKVTIVLPAIADQENISAEAENAAGSSVSFDVTASDGTPVNCVPSSGSQFTIGDTQVTCTATNPAGTTTKTFIVTVEDTIPPTLTCPTKVTETLPDDSTATSAVVNFETSSQDAVDGATAITCSKASGSTFDLGTTAVTCETSDSSNNQANCQFSVELAKAAAGGCNSQEKGSSSSFFIFILIMMVVRYLSCRRYTRQNL